MSSEMSTEGVAKSYDRLAPVYDFVFGPVFRKGRAESIKVAEAAAGKGGRILEIGVGTGISLPFYSKDTRLVGADISEDMLKVARQRVEKLGLSNVESIEVGDAENLRFEDESFDVVMAQYVVSAVPNPHKALDEFARVVKPGGEIVIATRQGAERGLRKGIEKTLDAGHHQARLAHGLPVRLVHQLGRQASGRAPDRAPAAAAARPLRAAALRKAARQSGAGRVTFPFHRATRGTR
jgi:phosphatidylethanolamine/phosphatidyl-N-methylethanolamine N-methyltransferase